MEAEKQNKVVNIPPQIACPNCGSGLSFVKEISFSYFYGDKINCPNCNKLIDWWTTILQNVKQRFFLFQMLAPVGAQSVAFRITLKPNQTIRVNFSDYGVPTETKILDINYTPQGGDLFPIEVHGNNPPRHSIPHEITLYPKPTPKADKHKETDVSVLVTWVPHTADDESWQNLIDAFEAFSQNRFTNCVIPANVAVESKLSRFLAKQLESYASKKNVTDFLENGATYSHQLNVLLPMVTSSNKLPPLPENIRGLLNRLRGLRNDLAHYGKIEQSLKIDAADLIVSALFGFHYLSLVSKHINAEVNERGHR